VVGRVRFGLGQPVYTVHAEVAAGYKHREGDDFSTPLFDVNGFEYDTYAFLGGRTTPSLIS